MTVKHIDHIASIMDPPARSDDISLPALLRHARTTYAEAMRRALTKADCDDIPANGLYVIGALAHHSSPLGQIITALGVSKQAAGQLVDTLVARGYLDREIDPQDRRRFTVTLTNRGGAAARVQTAARQRIDAALVAQVGQQHVDTTRATLIALIDLREGGATAGPPVSDPRTAPKKLPET